MSEHSSMSGKTPHQEARSIGAARRKELHDARTAEEQLALINERPGESRRERARLSR